LKFKNVFDTFLRGTLEVENGLNSDRICFQGHRKQREAAGSHFKKGTLNFVGSNVC
jgi:predicted PolB exonuclease-like 3'-5' exonuclease